MTKFDYLKNGRDLLAKAQEVGSFPSKAQQKECLEGFSRSYEQHVSSVKNYRKGKELGYFYGDVPSNLHQVRGKHEDILVAFDIDTDFVNELTLYRRQAKELTVVKPTKVVKQVVATDRQATHYGTCQVCGSVQKVDRINGKLASHGYHKTWGTHMSECRGSRQLPYEISNTYLLDFGILLEDRLSAIKDSLAINDTHIATPRQLKSEYNEIVNHVIPRIKARFQKWSKKDLTPIEGVVKW